MTEPNVIYLPNAKNTEMPDAPANDGDLEYILALEQENLDLRNLIAQHALDDRKTSRPTPAAYAGRLRLSAAVLMAFAAGWLLDPPGTILDGSTRAEPAKLVERSAVKPFSDADFWL